MTVEKTGTGRSAAADPLDELTALFLTKSQNGAESAHKDEGAFCELLIVGHLPVRGGVWLTPYADAVARQHGPTALVRMDLVPPTIELLRSSRGFGSRGESLTFEQAVMRAGEEARVWIVRPPNEPMGDIAVSFDRITVLTSADSAAVVAAYRIIKELVQNAGGDGASALPPISLAIVGATREAAEEVIERINETTTAQLGLRVSLACCLQRLDSGVQCTTFASFVENGHLAVEDLLRWIDAAEATGDEIEATIPDEEVSQPEPRQLRLSPMLERAEHVAPAVVTADAQPSDHGTPTPSAHDGQPEIKLAPKPATSTEMARGADVAAGPRNAHDSLAAFVSGLSALPVRCPLHEEVELATDTRGQVHVLAREGSLRELRVVETWAHSHRRLLAMACADRKIDPQGAVVCHLFSDEPASLADLHNTGLRLHVLAPVAIDGRTAWYSAPLTR